MKVQRRGVSSLRRSITLSVFAHAFFFLVCAILLQQRAAEIPIKQWTFIELDDRIPEFLKKRDLEKKDETPRKRIVQTVPGNPTDQAAPDAFLGERTQTVDRQTVSRDHNIAMGRAKTLARTANESSAAKNPSRTQSQAEQSRQAEQKKLSAVPMPALKSLGLPILPDAKKQEEINREASRDEPRWVSQSGDNIPKDYIKGLKESETTALNTKEYMFFGYYQRIRERLDRAWVPILREKLSKFYYSGRKLASDMDHSTKVLVVLNPGGEIIRVQVLSESGTADLDEAAIKAFNRAGPFPNPPQGMADKRGEIKVPWEFVLRT